MSSCDYLRAPKEHTCTAPMQCGASVGTMWSGGRSRLDEGWTAMTSNIGCSDDLCLTSFANQSFSLQISPPNKKARLTFSGRSECQNNSQKITPFGVERVYHGLKDFAYLKFQAGVQNSNNEGWIFLED